MRRCLRLSRLNLQRLIRNQRFRNLVKLTQQRLYINDLRFHRNHLLLGGEFSQGVVEAPINFSVVLLHKVHVLRLGNREQLIFKLHDLGIALARTQLQIIYFVTHLLPEGVDALLDSQYL